MKITVRLFSHFVKYLPGSATDLRDRATLPVRGLDAAELDVPSDETVGSVIGLLCIPQDVRRTITVNDKNYGEDRVLLDGDVVKIFPIAMGG